MSRSCVGSPASGRKSPSFMVRRSCPGRRPAGKSVRRRRPPCMLDAAMQRVIDLEGCLNFRDLGGYPTADGRTVRWQQVYRSDALHHLTPADVARVRDEMIVADYAATQENLEAIIERLMAAKGYQTMLSALPPDTLHAEAETMVAFLARIRERYGSMRGYARAAGVADAVVERLAERLLER